MANYKSIKPYADLIHNAAQNGGPDQFLREIAESNFALGQEAEKASEWWKIPLAGIAFVLIYEGGLWVYKRVKHNHQSKIKALNEQSDSAIKAYKECVVQKEETSTDESHGESEAGNQEDMSETP